ncbi:hypothetical protein UT300012_23120 [Paraclostridium bifermentans]
MSDKNKLEVDFDNGFGMDLEGDEFDLGVIFGAEENKAEEKLEEDFTGDFGEIDLGGEEDLTGSFESEVDFGGEIDLGGDEDLLSQDFSGELEGDPFDDMGEVDLGGDDNLTEENPMASVEIEDGILLSIPESMKVIDDLEGLDLEDDLDALLDEEEREANQEALQDAIDKRLKSRRAKDAKQKALEKVLASATSFSASYQAYFNAIVPVSSCARTEESIKSCGIKFTDPFLEEKAYAIVDIFGKTLTKYIRAGQPYDARTMVDTFPVIAITGLEEDRGYSIKDRILDTENYNALVDLLSILERSTRESEDISSKKQKNKKSQEQTNLDTFFPFINEIGVIKERILELAKDEPEELLDETAFVEKIDLTNDTYICGCCGKENKTVVPFYTNILFPVEAMDKVSISSVFGMNRCTECDSLNLMSVEEMDGLRIVHENGKTQYYRNLEEFHLSRSSLGTKTDDFGFTKYRASDNAVKNRLPGLFETTEVEMEIEEESYDPGALNQAVERYLGLLKYFKGRSNSSEVVNSISKDRQEEVSLVLDTVVFEEVPPNPDGTGKPVLQINKAVSDDAYKYESLAKLLATILSRDFNDIKQNAINSLISHLGSSRLSKYLRYSNHVQLKSAKLTAPLIKDLANASGEQLIANATDILSSFMLDEPINLVPLDKAHILSILREEYGKLDDKIEEYRTKRLNILNSIKHNISSYSYLTVSSIRVDSEIYLDLMQDPDIRFLVDIISNRMIITSLCEDFFHTWYHTISPKHARDIGNMKSDKADIVKAVMAVLDSKIVPHLRGRFKDGKIRTERGTKVVSRLEVGLYPDATTVGVLEHVLKLQSDIAIDEYRAILTLKEILDNRNSLMFEELESLMEFKEEIDVIVERCGKGDLGRFKYYLNPLGFSDKEIEDVYTPNLSNLQFHRIIKREQGESLETYLAKYAEAEGSYVRNSGDKDRLKAYLISIGFEAKDVDDYVDENWSKYATLDLNIEVKRLGESHPSSYLQRYMEVQNKVEKSNRDSWGKFDYTVYKPKFLIKLTDSSVNLDAIFVKANATVESELMHNPNTFFGMLTTLNTICKWCTTSEVLQILGYPQEIVNGLINSIPNKDFYNSNYEGFRDDVRALSYVYDNTLVNSAISESDSMESKISRLLHNYKDDLLDYVDYLPTVDKEFIDNFRYSRTFNPANIEDIDALD